MLTKLISLIPAQYRILAAVLAVAAVAAGSFGAGWKVNDWRLSEEITALKSDLKTCRGNKEALTASVEAQNKRIEEWRGKARDRREAAERAREAARERVNELEADMAALRSARPQTCDEAEMLINETLGL